MIEFDIKLAANELERFLRAFLIRQQSLTVLDLADAWRVLVPLDPGLQQFFDLVELFRVLQMDAVIEVMALGSRDQQLQRFLSGLSATSTTI